MSKTIPPELLEEAYRQGIFPMADEGGRIRWYSPDPRTIIDLDRFHISRRLARTIRSKKFEITVDRDFERVMRSCANREETWISDEIVAAYSALHRLGKAHSIEAYYEGKLAGGIYGVSLGGAFMGESMFTIVRDASKVSLAFLVGRLKERGYALFDVQFTTPHLKRFGAVEIPRREYLRRLEKALALPCRFD
ncbi:MAG TPA: leucyl/phenylalanyl-tRNA--protein transferase [Nitrospiria bacterium]|jgi:leucyl/phenylalanyl-tRNA--protein transferase|nr:leucyl/phenylalanyl-tRNA--protein transferase [Nitrospiria bacterium]